MANKYKMVDGQSIQLSDDEQTAVDNEQAAATSAIAAVAYKRKRQKEYGTVEEQLEYIVENGLDAFISKQNGIKSKYPK
jgi:hypothetical protein|tara:strand:- start:570 stop:806 length:237 start_codon:yes stop_codon:yes gene_type:complete